RGSRPKGEPPPGAPRGGGDNPDETRRAKSPLPVLPDSAATDLTRAQQRAEQPREEPRELMPRPQASPSVAPAVPKATDAQQTPDLPNASELTQSSLEAVRLEAQIAKQMEAYEKRPKRRFAGAAARR